MDLVTKIKDAVVPDLNNIPQTYSAEPESDIPGAFPDVEDETTAREPESEHKTSQGHKHQDSAVDVDDTSRFRSHDTSLPDTASVPPASSSDGDRVQEAAPRLDDSAPLGDDAPSSLLQRSPGDFSPHPDVGTGNSGDAMTKVEEVKPKHLGNEGKVLRTKCPSDVGTSGRGDEMTSTEEAGPQHLDQEGINAPAEPAEPGSSAYRSIPAIVQSREAAHKRTQGSDAGVAAESGGGTYEGVLKALSDISGGALPQQRDTASEARTAFSGGIHNGVLGAESDDPLGERSGSPHERSTQYRKGDVQNVISGVSQSGLGQGGVHNGVVGLGSQEEEAIRRHSADNQGQEQKDES